MANMNVNQGLKYNQPMQMDQHNHHVTRGAGLYNNGIEYCNKLRKSDHLCVGINKTGYLFSRKSFYFPLASVFNFFIRFTSSGR